VTVAAVLTRQAEADPQSALTWIGTDRLNVARELRAAVAITV